MHESKCTNFKLPTEKQTKTNSMASPFSLKWLHHHLPLYYKNAPHTGVCSTHSLPSIHQINYKHITQSSS